MNEDMIRQQLNQELDAININKLTQLGNQAVQLGLIAGHGYHKGKYEILRQGQALLMSPDEAQAYLEKLIQDVT